MIYLDHHAATPLAPGVRLAMDEARDGGWANPSSVHAAGRRARSILDRTRERLGATIEARPADLVLTGGGTEACNLAILGIGRHVRRIVTTGVEHPAVSAPIAALERAGLEVLRLDVPDGIVPPPAALALHADERTLVALTWVNHETGNVLSVEDYSGACRRVGALLFVDATQALGKVPTSVRRAGAHAIAVASHKMGGPAGAGALWLSPTVVMDPQLLGGEQERGRRAGSPDVIAAAGFGAACELVPGRIAAVAQVAVLRDRLEASVVALGGRVNGAGAPRVGTVTSDSFEGRRGAELVVALDLLGVCASSGAACSSGRGGPSAVVAAMYPEEPWRAAAALRLSLGPETTPEEVEAAARALGQVLGRVDLA